MRDEIISVGRDAGLRSGMAKDKLTFLIVCSVAIAVAVIAMVISFLPGESSQTGENQWQCEGCDARFELETSELPPIKCPECGGEAVGLSHRFCLTCREDVLVSRWRFTAEGKARHEDLEARGLTGANALPPLAAGLSSPREVQYWVRQDDGSYMWSEWLNSNGSVARELQVDLTCEKCGQLMSGRRRRSR